MASSINNVECVLIAFGITEKSRKIMARDFLNCDGLEDFLVSYVTADGLESKITDGFKEMPLNDVLRMVKDKMCWKIISCQSFVTYKREQDVSVVAKSGEDHTYSKKLLW